MADDDLVASLSEAVENDPDRNELRRLLVELLLNASRNGEALAHARHLLADEPDDLAALDAAIRASTALNDLVRADRYQRARDAFSEHLSRFHHHQRPDIPDSADELLARWQDVDAVEFEPAVGKLTRPMVLLRNIGGQLQVKDRLEQALFAPLRQPDLSVSVDTAIRGGTVLYGPPGCGKSYIARAVAGELQARFYHVGLADILDQWVGTRERNLASIFEVARNHAPCVLFLDDVDALGARRSNLRHAPSMRSLVNRLMSELDGVAADNSGVTILAATNHPWDIDSALLRPGRLGSLVFVPPPDSLAREQILEHHFAARPAKELDISELVERTAGYSCADLQEIADRAAEVALNRSVRTGRVVSIDAAMVRDAAAQVHSSTGVWTAVARNVVMFANHDGAYDDLAAWLPSQP